MNQRAALFPDAQPAAAQPPHVLRIAGRGKSGHHCGMAGSSRIPKLSPCILVTGLAVNALSNTIHAAFPI